MVRILKVQGDSMSPAIVDGQKVLALASKSFAVGDVVVTSSRYIKRIKNLNSCGVVHLQGDNVSKTSEIITDAKHLKYKVVYKGGK